MSAKDWWASEGVKVISFGGLASGMITLALGIGDLIPAAQAKYWLFANGAVQLVGAWFGKQLGNTISDSPDNSTTPVKKDA